MGNKSRWRRWGAAFGTVLAIGLSGATSADRADAAPAEEGFEIVQRATYRLDPAGAAVHVEIVTDITNQSPSTTSGGYIRSRYLPRYGVPVLAEATNVVATKDDGTPLDVSIEPVEDPRFSYAVADITDLFYPNSTTVRIAYDLPSLPPRSEAISRVNAAYARFPVYGDPGLSDVEVILPSEFEVEMSGDQLTKEDRGAETAYVARAIDNPDEFFTAISARNDDALVETDVDTEEVDIQIRAWPGDEAWGAFVAEQLEQGVPELTELIGQPWAGGKKLEVIETGAPYLYGYGGWYNQTNQRIEVGDRLDSVIILHELAHVYFNADLFASRWINEAFAEEYGREVADRLGSIVPPLRPIDPADPGAVRLNGWGDPVLDESISDARESYGYNASVSVLHQIREEIGFEGLAKVIAAAADRQIAYRGDPEPEHAGGAPNWQRFLDLLDEIGASKLADGLFSTYVTHGDEDNQMAARAKSRSAYDALEARGDEWSPPHLVRKHMSAWNFGLADSAMTDSLAILDTRDELAETLEPIGLPVPGALEEAYENANGAREIEAVAKQAEELLAAADDIVASHNAVHDSRGIFAKVGLLFADPDGTLDEAEEAFDRGEAVLATEKANAARHAVDDAATAGQHRAGGGIAVLGAATLGGVLLRRRRRNRPPSEPVAPPSAVEPYEFPIVPPYVPPDAYEQPSTAD